MEPKQGNFEGWALVELFGHAKEAGYVTTENYGSAAMFRVDIPGLPAREFGLTTPEYVGGEWMPAGSKVQRPESPARTRLIGPGAVYSLNPCTEEMCRQAIEKLAPRPLILLERAPGERVAISGSLEDEEDDDEVIF